MGSACVLQHQLQQSLSGHVRNPDVLQKLIACDIKILNALDFAAFWHQTLPCTFASIVSINILVMRHSSS